MGNWVTSGITEVVEGLLCCATSVLSLINSKCSVSHPRFTFALFLLMGTVLSFVVLVPNMRPLLGKIPYFCTAVTTEEICDNMVGYGAVYRICFSLSIFYLSFAAFMINVTTTTDFRYKVHNGYWFFKLFFLVLVMVGAFHIPRHTEFGRVLMYVGLTTGFMFILIQIILVIDFAHSWSFSWAEKVDSESTNGWYFALAITAVLLYSVAVTMAVFFYLFFTKLPDLTKCRGNIFLITFNLSQCALASLVSILPRVQEESLGSGLLQSSVVSLYAMYLTWCTLSSEPDGACNPLGDVILDYDKASGVNGQALFECVLMFALLVFACNVRPSTSNLEKIGFSLSKNIAAENYNYIKNYEKMPKKQDKNDDINDDEEEKLVVYSYSYFHFVMFLASLQLMMVVTNWHSPDELSDMKRLVKNWATVWIQLSSSILCVLIYIWAIVTPLLVKTWGPCLGLDYEVVPSIDEYEYERLRRHAEAIRVSEELIERPQTIKNLRTQNFKNKSDFSTLDSGVFDHTASREMSSHIRVTSDDVVNSRTSGADERSAQQIQQTTAVIHSQSNTLCEVSYEGNSISEDKLRTQLGQSADIECGHNTSCDNYHEKDHSNEQLTEITENLQRVPTRLSECGRQNTTHAGSTSALDERTQSRLSERTGNSRRPSYSRPSSRLLRSHGDELTEAKSAEDNRRVLVSEKDEDNRKVSEDLRGTYPQMRDHIAWLKRAREKHGGSMVPSLTTKDQSGTKSAQNDTKNGAPSLGNGKERDWLDKKDIVEQKHRENQEKTGKFQTNSNSFEATDAITEKRGRTDEHDDSAIFRHPFVHTHGERTLVNAPQEPDVAKEILRLHAKILKFQAKVVKTQQDILEIQSHL